MVVGARQVLPEKRAGERPRGSAEAWWRELLDRTQADRVWAAKVKELVVGGAAQCVTCGTAHIKYASKTKTRT